MNSRVYLLAGPTACGKTAVAHELAHRHSFLLLSADSMLVYKGMDIGTAKPSPEERKGLSYAGLDLVTPAESCSAGIYLQAAKAALQEAQSARQDVLVVGGTGLYFDLLLQGLEESEDAPTVPPDLRNKFQQMLTTGGLKALQEEVEKRRPGLLSQMADPQNPRRVQRVLERLEMGLNPLPGRPAIPPLGADGALFAQSHFVVLSTPAPVLAERIEARIDRMFEEGLLAEVRGLIDTWPEWSGTASAAIGYAEARAVLEGKMTEREAKERIAARTRQLAKRQRTWFRNRAPMARWVEGPTDGRDLDRVVEAVGTILGLG